MWGVYMKYSIFVPRGASFYYFPLLPDGNFQKIVIDGVVVFDIYKRHNHCYCLDAFFYSSKRIFSGFWYKSKKELYCAIQNLLQEELHVDVQ